MAPFHGYEFLLAFHSKYIPIISEMKRNIGRKSRFFNTQPAFDAPCWGPRPNIAIKFCTEKTRMVWLPEDEQNLICSAVSTQYRRVTEGQTDRQILRHSAHYACALRGKNERGAFLRLQCTTKYQLETLNQACRHGFYRLASRLCLIL